MQSTLYWKPQCMAFQNRFLMLTYDARAQGQSDRGSGKLSLEVHASDLEALLNSLKIERAQLVGLSHGAKVAIALAANSPKHVSGLVLCSISATPSCRSKLFIRVWLDLLKEIGLEAMVWASMPVFLGNSYLKQKESILGGIVKAMVKRNQKEALIAHLEAMIAYPPLSQLAVRVHTPTLVISASDDPLVTKKEAKDLAMLCNGQHKHLLDVGHSVPSEAPALFNQTLLEFFDKTSTM